jgi:hypothetical protein
MHVYAYIYCEINFRKHVHDVVIKNQHIYIINIYTELELDRDHEIDIFKFGSLSSM